MDAIFGSQAKEEVDVRWWLQVGSQVMEGKVLNASEEVFGWHLEEGCLDVVTEGLGWVGDETKVTKALLSHGFDDGR